MSKSKNKRPQRAKDAKVGGSRVAVAAHEAPGGTHGRRPVPRATQKRRAIEEAS